MRARQSPRTPGVTTPRAEDERSGADDTTEDVAFADENESLNPGTEPPTTGKKKRGRSPNWLSPNAPGVALVNSSLNYY